MKQKRKPLILLRILINLILVATAALLVECVVFQFPALYYKEKPQDIICDGSDPQIEIRTKNALAKLSDEEIRSIEVEQSNQKLLAEYQGEVYEEKLDENLVKKDGTLYRRVKKTVIDAALSQPYYIHKLDLRVPVTESAPEGENTILPCTWHQTGISFWGRTGDFRYELQMIAGLDAWQFSRDQWIKPGTTKPFEFETANKYGFSARVDNYTIPGLRVGLSGYYGQSMHNAVPHDMETGKNKNIKGNIYLGAVDFTYNAHNWIARGNADYGYVSDAKTISAIRKPGTQYVKPYESNQAFGSHAIATGIEIGYDIFSQIAKLRADKQKLYVFGHFEYYNSCLGSSKEYTSKKIFAGGINYYPLPQICVKAEYSYRKFKSQYNDEPAINIGVAYQGMFL